MKKGFWKEGHWPTLLGSLLYFDVSFMLWVMLGATSVFITQEIPMTPSQKGLMVAIPILGGSIFRILMGVLTDTIGGRKTAILGMCLTMIPLAALWLFAGSIPELYAYGFLLGIAGASFAAALPLASRWYPPHYQGLVMGIAGAGNSGTLFATLFAPRLANYFGDWHPVFGLAMIPLFVVIVTFVLIAKDSPNQPAPKKATEYMQVLKEKDAWLFNFFYFITFGGFVGMTSFLPIFIHDQYGLDSVRTGDFVTMCVVAGSICRPIGGWLADRVGGVAVLKVLFFLIAILLSVSSQLLPFWLQMTVLFLIMMGYGMGNGAVFQLVPLRFQQEIGVVTGIVGAAGGIGGFFLPTILGFFKELTGTYTAGLLFLTIIVSIAAWMMLAVGGRFAYARRERVAEQLP
ncbi:nitrate/nitrite transporter [Brevibacillus migulae]|uniref:nitrate/nitrite transporter n=1 Tax=Brevibacillus migulae TaxID=1644114 RepID=UPI00106E0B46|nr:nitrate/nitrite transporter [Brevibacillus migulae]